MYLGNSVTENDLRDCHRYLGPGKAPPFEKKKINCGKNKIPTYFQSTPTYSKSNFMLNYKISNQSDKKDAIFETNQYARPYILTLKGVGYRTWS